MGRREEGLGKNLSTGYRTQEYNMALSLSLRGAIGDEAI